MKILGVTIDNLSKKQLLSQIEDFLAEHKTRQIATINPEFVLQAQKDFEFRDILNDCDLRLADGVGIWFAFLRFGNFLKARMTGIDLMQEIIEIAAKKKLKIFLVSDARALSSWQETRGVINKTYPDLEISGVAIDKKTSNYKLPPINSEIVFCNFGAPDQERFLYSLKNRENDIIRLVMGVGGSFDFLTDKRKRAPKIMRKIGLEWLWRFAQEPRYRAKRIFQAIVIFPLKIIFN